MVDRLTGISTAWGGLIVVKVIIEQGCADTKYAC